jgi:hypothetical protein
VAGEQRHRGLAGPDDALAGEPPHAGHARGAGRLAPHARRVDRGFAASSSSSSTAATTPSVSAITRTARSQLAGSPILIAVATVSARTARRSAKPPRKAAANGAAPAACTAATRGTRSTRPRARASRSAAPTAEVLPRLPAGSTIQSGARQPSCWRSSNTTLFCPATR